ncbi:MAG: Ig domain-containing protein, partial [Gemmatimonadetes bacterium]|nr:Ig domain-containing protein [Gemmatimonadota bacterium]
MRLTGQMGMWAFAAAVVGCGGGDAPPAPPKVTTVTVTAGAAQVEVGATVQFTAAAKDAKGAAMAASFTWTSAAPTVASVDGAGVVTGVAPGTASITATADGVSATASITVIPVPVVAVLIAQRTPSVRQGETVQLSAIAQDGVGRPLAGRTITWSSLNPAVATVTAAGGLVTAVTSGSAFIRATSEGKSDSVSLRVKSLNAPTFATTTPSQWAPGTAATITGTNFSTIASENEVLVNGVSAAITASTATTVSFTVPAATALPCSATGAVPVGVVVNGDTAVGTANLRVATQRTLALGQSLLLTSASDIMCNEFAATGGKYLITAFNTSTSSAARATFQLLGASTSGSAIEASMPALVGAQAGPTRAALQALDGERFARGHLAVLQDHERFSARQGRIREVLRARQARERSGGELGTMARTSAAPGTSLRTPPVAPPNVGDKQWIRMR